MNKLAPVFKAPRSTEWTRERVESLESTELSQLLANADRLGETALAAECREILAARPRGGGRATANARTRQLRRLVPRSRAFSARGVWLADPRTSWSGVRKSDGVVVIALWHAAILTQGGTCHYLLWAPNVDGARPWSDSPPGRERREHCKLASGAEAEGLLVHGESLPGRLPEERARSILGIDMETIVRLRVELRGEEYWAAWGRAA